MRGERWAISKRRGQDLVPLLPDLPTPSPLQPVIPPVHSFLPAPALPLTSCRQQPLLILLLHLRPPQFLQHAAQPRFHKAVCDGHKAHLQFQHQGGDNIRPYESNHMYVYSEVGPSTVNGAYSQVNMLMLAALIHLHCYFQMRFFLKRICMILQWL